ncbi:MULTISPECIES: DUF1707 SHOCT-like domain-containing protein [Thermomonosporaceae]|uniref:DUF1707 SHOCT-like domain-containing protein n=1 Tax=Thermomonosporaceae TaxID=2012 RepID=UPI00255AE2E7|nr:MULTISPECIES: DUF1707 domain-containing protein [Thermomonosporaceae]MDL4774888.1 DUF1707 domain-containing protein [Actinomadura xylanilytica]
MVTRPDDLRIGDAERDAATAALHDHFAAGRLDRAELDQRLGAALGAKTRGDLRGVLRDLPGPDVLAEPSPMSATPFGAAFGPAYGPAVRGPFGRPGRGPFGHPAHFHGHGHPARHHGHHARHHPFAAFPLLVGVFVFTTIAVGPGAAVLTVLQIAMLIWIVRAVILAVSVRRARRVR